MDRFGPGDRAAVVVFDSRLCIWRDFTTDRGRLAQVLGRGVVFDEPDPTVSEGVAVAVESPVPKGGRHAIRVRAEARRAVVSARRYYID